MKICSECQSKMIKKTNKTPEDISYRYYRCNKCGNEIVDMKQLHAVAKKYRTMKRYHVKLSKWGLSLGLRIPRELINKYKLADKEEVSIVPEKQGILIVPS